MAKIIGVRFRHGGKMYYFDPKDLPIKYDDAVIVETARGIEYGRVKVAPMELEDDKIRQPLKEVLRIATEEDTAKEQDYALKEKDALKICRKKILERGLEMKLIAAEYAFDDSKLLFYFTADGRIDFRELVKDLASIFRRRIELRQIGVRDETKILGGMGICGRPLCCHTYLSDFAPVSIKMAKEQNLSLNPAKISGCCGRLMCCLNNEAETYCELKKGMPSKGDQATTPEGRHGEVYSINILRQTVKIVVDMDDDEKEMQEYPVSEIQFIPHSKKPKPQPKKKTEEEKDAEKAAREVIAKAENEQRSMQEAIDAERDEKAEDKAPDHEEKAERREHRRPNHHNRENERHAEADKNVSRQPSSENEDNSNHEITERGNRPQKRFHGKPDHRKFDNNHERQSNGDEAGKHSENAKSHNENAKPHNENGKPYRENGRPHTEMNEGAPEGEAMKKKHHHHRRKRKPGEGAPSGENKAPEKSE